MGPPIHSSLEYVFTVPGFHLVQYGLYGDAKSFFASAIRGNLDHVIDAPPCAMF